MTLTLGDAYSVVREAGGAHGAALHGGGPGQRDCGRSGAHRAFVSGNGWRRRSRVSRAGCSCGAPPPWPSVSGSISDCRASLRSTSPPRWRPAQACSCGSAGTRRVAILVALGRRRVRAGEGPQRHRRHAASRRDHRRSGRHGPRGFGRTRGAETDGHHPRARQYRRAAAGPHSGAAAALGLCQAGPAAHWQPRVLQGEAVAASHTRSAGRLRLWPETVVRQRRRNRAGHDAHHHARYARSAPRAARCDTLRHSRRHGCAHSCGTG